MGVIHDRWAAYKKAQAGPVGVGDCVSFTSSYIGGQSTQQPLVLDTIHGDSIRLDADTCVLAPGIYDVSVYVGTETGTGRAIPSVSLYPNPDGFNFDGTTAQTVDVQVGSNSARYHAILPVRDVDSVLSVGIWWATDHGGSPTPAYLGADIVKIA